MTIQLAYQQLLSKLFSIYDEREAANIADWVIEHITGFKKIDRIINKTFQLNEGQQTQIAEASKQLLQHVPVQYALHEAWFAAMKLYVDENVLIPRPETEELVEWVANSKVKSKNAKISVLDIGTGSGCIAIAIKKALQNADVSGIDVSEGALDVASQNTKEQSTSINFMQLDFLNEDEWKRLTKFDVIVSNPPYIKQSEDQRMNKNVLEHEPHLALFVPNEDALIFYRKIALFGKEHLAKNGEIFLEINEALSVEVQALFTGFGYTSVEIKKDMQGKDRMVKVRF
jgi:release factor glutamine methyltransferase